jgi:hypothetical protein
MSMAEGAQGINQMCRAASTLKIKKILVYII